MSRLPSIDWLRANLPAMSPAAARFVVELFVGVDSERLPDDLLTSLVERARTDAPAWEPPTKASLAARAVGFEPPPKASPRVEEWESEIKEDDE